MEMDPDLASGTSPTFFFQKMSATFSHNESFRHKRLYGVLGKIFCSEFSPTVPLCALGLFMLAGWDPKQLDKVSRDLRWDSTVVSR